MKIYAGFIISLLIGSFLPAQAPDKNPINPHRFNDAERWEKIFEDTIRNEWQKPEQVIELMNIPENAVIADIGSATGYFPVRFAMAANKGKIYGIDIEPEMVDFLNKRARKEGFENLRSILGKPDNPLIPEKVDFIFICNTYHHINERPKYFSRLKGDLKPGGVLVIVDFLKGDLPVGPPDKHKLAFTQVIEELALAGYDLVQHYQELPYQYMLTFKIKM
ncbi:MAG: class I SAM-dependent methyltransferase [Candidatus Neomarinimicrobiota bacterium]